MTQNKVTILGCGSSGGVPRIGNDWGACDPNEPKNLRTRCSIHVELNCKQERPLAILIDTAPELRLQLLRSDIRHVDAVLYTHTHADQCHGIDDLRAIAYRNRARLPIFGSEATQEELRQRFSYCFVTPDGSPYPPILDLRPPLTVGATNTLRIADDKQIDVTPLDQDHGSMRSTGFRIGSMAYCNDVVELPEETLEQLGDLDLLIVDALRYEPHPTHAHLERTLGWIERLKPNRAVLTNLHIDMDYQRLISELPSGVEPAYDSMKLYFP